MVRRRVVKKKKSSRFSNRLQRDTRLVTGQLSSSKFSSDINKSLGNENNRSYEHPYATRSKTLRTAKSSMNVEANNLPRLKRRRSDSSIVYLGTYRKVPQLIVLEESTEGRCIEYVEKPEAIICLKAEKMDCQSSED